MYDSGTAFASIVAECFIFVLDMKKLVMLPLLLLALAIAQSDPQATALLKQSNDRLAAATDIKATYSQKLMQNGVVKGSQSGTVWLKGSKFRVEMPGQKLICNGSKIWRCLPDDEEAYESVYNAADSFTPDRMFKFSQTETKAKYISANSIQLFPNAGKNYDWWRVDMEFNPTTKFPSKLTVYNRTGTLTVYTISALTTNTGVADAQFTYSESRDCSGCELIKE